MLSKLVTFLTLAVLTLSIGGRAEAQPADYRTYFTFSAPVTLPGMTLPAGKYIFRLADPDGSRKVINVMSGDGKKSLAMLHTIPNQALASAEGCRDPVHGDQRAGSASGEDLVVRGQVDRLRIHLSTEAGTAAREVHV